MKRDMDLIREILKAIEDGSTGYAPKEIKIEGYSEDQIGYHTLLTMEAGLVHGFETTHMESTSPEAKPIRLTWDGHEFLALSRDPTIWERAKAVSDKVGGVTLSIMTNILTQLVTKTLVLPD